MISKRMVMAATIAISLMPGIALAQGNNDFAPSGTQNDMPPPMPPPREGPSAGNGEGRGGPGQGGGFRRGGFRGGRGQGESGQGGPGQGGEFRERMLKRFDTNGNGVLDDNEKAQLEALRAQRGRGRDGQGGGGGGFPGGPPPGGPGGQAGVGGGFPGGPPGGPGGQAGGGGQREHGDRAQMRERMMKRFDTNGDGQLDAQEQAAADAARREHREQRMQRMQSGDQGGGVRNWGRGRPGGGNQGAPDSPQGNPPPPQ